jgi:hypothetical protein
MKRTKQTLQPSALLIAALCVIAMPAAARPSTSTGRQSTGTIASTGTVAGGIATTPMNGDEVCTCIATYSDGSSDEVSECARSECPDLETYNACRDAGSTGVMPIGGCRLLDACACECRSTELVVQEYVDEDIFLAGVPNLWQFDYACGAFGANAVGCGPVAATTVMYWWAQQGYDGLVTGFMSGRGTSPVEREHDWQGMVETFRDDYLDGGFCVAGQYATLQGTMRNGIDDFIADAGYAASVDHYKVCDGCNRNAADELAADDGLDVVISELAQGRPVIMGFNVGPATATTDTFDDYESDPVVAYDGELSNGAPATGIISHYAVITGYQRIDSQDIVYLNLGWQQWEDVPFLWNVAGKWLHLYTVDMHEGASGDEFCSIDRGIDDTFLDDDDLDLSFDSNTVPRTVLAGAMCGILREEHVSEYYPQWNGAQFECDPYGGFADIEPLDTSMGGSTSGTHSGGSLHNGGPAILDEQLPLP